MMCKNCGYMLDGEPAYCPNCGTLIDYKTVTQNPPLQGSPYQGSSNLAPPSQIP
ncbi:MAG: zinc-ribbon domain, partial [Herbinix sp.]|nr:zinc-ribbon domain [Herbinix sp.]